MLEDQHEVAARGERGSAPDHVPVAERREEPDLPGQGLRGSRRGEREALDGDDGAREGVDGAEDLGVGGGGGGWR